MTNISGRAKFVSPTEIEVDDHKYQGKKFIIATGSTANTKDLSLQVAGVEIDERQAVKVNEYQKTSQDHIFAVGKEFIS